MSCLMMPRRLLPADRRDLLRTRKPQSYSPGRVSPWASLPVELKEARVMPIQSLIPISAATSPMWLSLLGGGTVIGLLAAAQKYAEFVVSRRDIHAEKLRSDAEKAKLEAASIAIAHIAQEGEESKKAERMIALLLDERKDQVAGLKGEVVELKTDMSAQRREFDAKIVQLQEGQAREAEARQMVKLSADAAHIRADEAVKNLAIAKMERDELTRKLLLVEQRAGRAEERTEKVEQEKNLAVHLLSDQLDAANQKIAGLEEYIKAHKLTLKLEGGGQIVTATLDPLLPLPSTTPAPPDRDGDAD